MTRSKARRHFDLLNGLQTRFGISSDDACALLRIEKTLHTWAEHEANGTRYTDDAGRAFGVNPMSGFEWRTANRESGALRRLASIMERYPNATYHHQGDPRGCALYIIDANEKNPDANYTRGIAVCI
jgi:hypothetical protein